MNVYECVSLSLYPSFQCSQGYGGFRVFCEGCSLDMRDWLSLNPDFPVRFPLAPQFGFLLRWMIVFQLGWLRSGIIVSQIHFKWDVGMVRPGALVMSETWLAVVITSSLDWSQIGFDKMGFDFANAALELPAMDGWEINADLDWFWDNCGSGASHLHKVTSFEHTTLTPVEISQCFEAFSSSAFKVSKRQGRMFDEWHSGRVLACEIWSNMDGYGKIIDGSPILWHDESTRSSMSISSIFQTYESSAIAA